MKQYIQYLLLLGICAPVFADSDQQNESHDTDESGRSHLSVQPLFHSAQPEYVSMFRGSRTHMVQDDMDNEDSCGRRWWGHNAMQFAVFGGKSRHSSALARYFLPNGQETITIGEQSKAPNSPNFPDVLASNLNIFTVEDNYLATITLSPQQTTVGGAFDFRWSFWRSEEKGRGFWLEVLLPFARVKNQLNLTENPITTSAPDTTISDATGVPVFNNATEAFKQAAWLFDKIDDSASAMKRTRVSDMEIKLGYEWIDYEPYHVESYLGFLAPTSKTETAEYLWAAQPGFGGYWGIMWGSAGGMNIYNNDEKEFSVRFETNCHSQYLFRKNQVRTLDLKNKPWSRFLPLYVNQAQAQEAASLIPTNLINAQNLATPGVNVLTRTVQVTPGFMFDHNSAFVLSWKKFEFEAGYNLFGRQGEDIKLVDSFNGNNPAIKDLNGQGFTNPIRNVSGNDFLLRAVVTPTVLDPVPLPVPLANYSTSAINDNDLDLASAATPCLLAHTIYGTLGYNWDEMKYPMFANFGGSVTFSRSNNAVMERWAFWGKFGISM